MASDALECVRRWGFTPDPACANCRGTGVFAEDAAGNPTEPCHFCLSDAIRYGELDGIADGVGYIGGVAVNDGQPAQEWLEELFASELCAECRGDAQDHEVVFSPVGTYFAKCKLPRADTVVVVLVGGLVDGVYGTGTGRVVIVQDVDDLDEDEDDITAEDADGHAHRFAIREDEALTMAEMPLVVRRAITKFETPDHEKEGT